MKKLGTPIGAEPGRAKLKVGLTAVGTPPGPVALSGAADGFLAAFGRFFFLEEVLFFVPLLAGEVLPLECLPE
jgi:hypothetical protein